MECLARWKFIFHENIFPRKMIFHLHFLLVGGMGMIFFPLTFSATWHNKKYFPIQHYKKAYY